MLEHLPKAIGNALRGNRPGVDKLAVNAPELDTAEVIEVASPAFADGGALPARFTADGEGLSPPLQWNGAPLDACCAVLLVEDADSPTPHPLVHAIAPLLPANGDIPEGSLPSAGHPGLTQMGRNSYFRHDYLPPDPPPAHGTHRYAFELFALKEAPQDPSNMGRSALIEWMRGRVLAKGYLIGTYERP
ncbi:MAG TPA: YbhB/YbcL family Raf kinase inhibitor-like protein [Pseudolabrys sp.]|nr:YbhB/YbcL family Raf kinase inhibitor-like protein [Pseudolabrys sp.]